MASALRLIMSAKNGARLDFGFGGVGGMLADTTVEVGAGYAIGQVYHRYGHTTAGKYAPRLAAIGGKLGALILSAATGGNGHPFVGVLNGIGSAGAAGVGLELGLRHARSQTGKRAVLLPKDAALPANGREITTIGALPPAPAGRALSMEQIEELAMQR